MTRFISFNGLPWPTLDTVEVDHLKFQHATMRFWDLSGLKLLEVGSGRPLSLDIREAPSLHELTLLMPFLREAKLAETPKLEKLHLRWMHLDRQDNFPIEQCAGLRHLTLETHADQTWQLSKLGELPKLEELSLIGGKLKGPEFEQLRGLGRLRALDLQNCQPGAGTLRSLRGLESLESLYLENVQLDAEDIETIGTLHNLQSLAFLSTTLAEDGLVHLYCLPHLRSVTVNSSRARQSPEDLDGWRFKSGAAPSFPTISLKAIQNLSLALPPECCVKYVHESGTSSFFVARFIHCGTTLDFVAGQQVEIKTSKFK